MIEVLKKGSIKGFLFLIVRRRLGICSYIAVPNSHPWANKDYMDLPYCDFTYSRESEKFDISFFPKGLWVFGNDYMDHYRMVHTDIGSTFRVEPAGPELVLRGLRKTASILSPSKFYFS